MTIGDDYHNEAGKCGKHYIHHGIMQPCPYCEADKLRLELHDMTRTAKRQASVISNLQTALARWKECSIFGHIACEKHYESHVGEFKDCPYCTSEKLAAKNKVLIARNHEHELFRQQHRDCDKMAIELQALKLKLRVIDEKIYVGWIDDIVEMLNRRK